MKLCLAFAVVAAAAAAAPPRISLDLATGVMVQRDNAAVAATHGLLQPNGDPVMSRQDWAEECAASSATSESTCPFPVAKAFDHNDQTIQVREQIFLTYLIEDGEGAAGTTLVTRDQVRFDRRAIYLFKFDATDDAGNHAEQVVFELVLNDVTAPQLTLPSCPDQPFHATDYPNSPKTCIFEASSGTKVMTVEAASGWTLGQASVVARDNCGETTCATAAASWSQINEQLRFCVTQCTEQMASCEEQAAGCSSWVTATDESLTTTLATTQAGTRYFIKVGVSDYAGILGAGGAENTAEAAIDVSFVDTTAPTITVLGQTPELFTCNHAVTYTDTSNGVNAAGNANPAVALSDNLDSSTTLAAALVTDLSSVNTGIPNDYYVTYNVQDAASNPAVGCANTANGPQTCGAKRLVQVRDQADPTIEPADGFYQIDYLVGSITDIDDIDAGVTVSDDCDADIANRTVTRSWVELPTDPLTGQPLTTWAANKNGTFVREYTVCDLSSRCSSFRRTFVGTDNTVPVIKVLGSQTVKIVARSDNAPYEDDGATCNDYVDGLFSATVSEAGDEVLTRVPGTYIIRYECTDLSGNSAQEATRTVNVVDEDGPTITLNPPLVVHVEAGQTYTDPGWTTTDDIDGDLTQKCTHASKSATAPKGCTTVTPDTINEMGAFVSRRSCAEIKSEQTDDSPTGWYYITTFVTATESFSRVKVWCDMDTQNLQDDTPGFTYFLCEGCTSVLPYGTEQGDCASFGMHMAEFDGDNFRTGDQWLGAKAGMGASRIQYFTASGIASTNYLCSVNDHNDEAAHSSQDDIRNGMYHGSLSTSIAHDKMEANEQGKYIIEYRAKDLAGNDEVAVQRRTVIVRDTFKPVISLHMKNAQGVEKLIQHSSARAGNPALDPTQNPFLNDGPFIALRASGSAGWMLAAAASAVAGVALLAASSRRSAVTTSVPV